MKTVNIVLLSLILFFILLFGFITIIFLSSLFSRISDIEYSYGYSLSEDESIIDDQYNIISDYSITYENLNSEKATMDISVSIIPKEFTNSTTAVFYLDHNTKINLTRNGDFFVGSISVPIYKSYEYPSVSLTNGETTVNEVLGEWIDFRSHVEENFYAEVSGSNKITNNSIVLNDVIYISYTPYNNISIDSAQICVLADNNTIWSEKTPSLKPNDETTININQTIDNKNYTTVSLLLEITDNSGFRYVYVTDLIEDSVYSPDSVTLWSRLFGGWTDFSDSWISFSDLKVYDKNGKEIIFDF